MVGPCSIIERESQLVLSVRTRTPIEELSDLIGITYRKIFQYMQEFGEVPSGAPFVGYFNMDMSDLDIEIGFPVSKALPGNEEIISNQIPAGKYATTIYTGPYEGLKEAYRELSDWLHKNEWTAGDIAYEFYLNDPVLVSESELQTQIFLGVK